MVVTDSGYESKSEYDRSSRECVIYVRLASDIWKVKDILVYVSNFLTTTSNQSLSRLHVLQDFFDRIYDLSI